MATVSVGPSSDSLQRCQVLAQASWVVTWDRLLADAALGSKEHHRYCQEGLGVRATVIPLNRCYRGRKRPKVRNRRQMVKRFHKKPKGRRHHRVYEARLLLAQAAAREQVGSVGCVTRARMPTLGDDP